MCLVSTDIKYVAEICESLVAVLNLKKARKAFRAERCCQSGETSNHVRPEFPDFWVLFRAEAEEANLLTFTTPNQ